MIKNMKKKIITMVLLGMLLMIGMFSLAVSATNIAYGDITVNKNSDMIINHEYVTDIDTEEFLSDANVEEYKHMTPGPNDEDFATIEIYVKRDKDEAPINRATIMLGQGLNVHRYRTDRAGHCKIEVDVSGLLPKQINIQVSKFGYHPITKNIYNLRPGDTVILDLEMKQFGDSHSKSKMSLYNLFDRFQLIRELLTF